jgi:hypothetical protein
VLQIQGEALVQRCGGSSAALTIDLGEGMSVALPGESRWPTQALAQSSRTDSSSLAMPNFTRSDSADRASALHAVDRVSPTASRWDELAPSTSYASGRRAKLVRLETQPRDDAATSSTALIENDKEPFLNIRVEAQFVRITVIKGSAHVRGPNVRDGLCPLACTSAPDFYLHAGDELQYGLDVPRPGFSVQHLSRETLERRIAWMKGDLWIDDEALRDLVAEVNRFNVRQLEIADPAIADLRLAGRIRPRELDHLIAGLEHLGIFVKKQTSSAMSGHGRLLLVGADP